MALEFQEVVEQVYCELIVAHRERWRNRPKLAELSVSGLTPRGTLHDFCVARFAARCHPVRGFEGGRGEDRPGLGPVPPGVTDDDLRPTLSAVTPA